MRVGAAILPRLHEEPVGRLADLVAVAAYATVRSARRGIAMNLAHVIDPGDPDLVALRAREALRTQARNYVDLFRLPHLSLVEIERRVEVEGWQHLEDAVTEGRGAIVVSLHLGNIDLVAQLACARQVPVTIPVEPLRPRALLAFVTGLRSAHGLRLVPIDENALNTVRSALRRGEVVAFAVDRDVQGSGEVVDFLGAPARIATAAVVLALRSGAPVLPVRSKRIGSGRFYVEIGAPVRPLRGPQAGARLLRAILDQLERYLRQAPGQWVMFQPLWRS